MSTFVVPCDSLFSVLHQPSVRETCGWLQCLLLSSGTSAAALPSTNPRSTLGLVLVTCLLPWLTNKAAALDSDNEDTQVNDRAVLKNWQGLIFLLRKFVSNSTVFRSWCLLYSGGVRWKAADLPLFCPPVSAKNSSPTANQELGATMTCCMRQLLRKK